VLEFLQPDASGGPIEHESAGSHKYYRAHVCLLPERGEWVGWCEHGHVGRGPSHRLIAHGDEAGPVIEAVNRRVSEKLTRKTDPYREVSGSALIDPLQLGLPPHDEGTT
jgi:hypothetical protein